jgi:hypothetical protein
MQSTDGLYTIQTSNGKSRLLHLSPDTADVTPVTDLNVSPNSFGVTALAFGPDGKTIVHSGGTLYTVDFDTGDVERFTDMPRGTPGVAFRDAETLYAMENSRDELLELDAATGERQDAIQFSTDINHTGLAVNFQTRELYALGGKEDGQEDRLYHIDLENRTLEEIGPTGIDINSVGVEFVPGTGELYSVRGSKANTTTLRKMDLQTGVGIKIGDVPVPGLANLGAPWPGSSQVTPPPDRTPVQSETQTGETPTPTGTPGTYAFQEGSTLEVTVGNRRLFVISEIPGEVPSRRAVTTPGYDLVPLETARDALITEVWKNYGPASIDWRSSLEEAKQNAAEFQTYEILSRAVAIGIDGLETYALLHVNPKLAIGPAVDALGDSMNWALNEYNDPYKEAFGKMTRVTAECRDFQSAASQITHRAEFTEQLETAVEFSLALHDLMEGGAGMASAWQEAGSTTAGIKAGLTSQAVKSSLKTVFIGFAIDTVSDELIEGALEANAKIFAAAHAHEMARIPILENIIAYELKRRDAALSPVEATIFMRFKAAYFQLSALFAEVAQIYYEELNSLWTAPVWDLLVGTDDKLAQLTEMAEGSRTAAQWQWKLDGAARDRANRRLEQSINAAEYGGTRS